MAPNPETIPILHTLRGATATVLLALLFHPDQPLGTTDLCTLTGYTDKPVTAALRKLHSVGLAQRHARYVGWTATRHVRQLTLGEHLLWDSESETFRLADSSSRSDLPSPQQTSLLPPPSAGSESEKLRLPSPRWHAVAEAMIQHAGTPRRLALDTTRAAAQHYPHPGQARYHAIKWADYARSCDTINNPAYFVPSRIADGIPSPPDHHCTHPQLAALAADARHQWIAEEEAANWTEERDQGGERHLSF
jgi:hypothetical protein